MLNDIVVLYLVFKGASILFIKKSKIMPFAATWMDLEIIIPSEVSQTAKDRCHMTSLTCESNLRKTDTIELIYKTATDLQTWKANSW